MPQKLWSIHRTSKNLPSVDKSTNVRYLIHQSTYSSDDDDGNEDGDLAARIGNYKDNIEPSDTDWDSSTFVEMV